MLSIVKGGLVALDDRDLLLERENIELQDDKNELTRLFLDEVVDSGVWLLSETVDCGRAGSRFVVGVLVAIFALSLFAGVVTDDR